MSEKQPTNDGRRSFMKTTAGAVAAHLAVTHGMYAQGKEEIKVGLVGCGGRGTGAAGNAIESNPAVRLVAVADLFDHGAKGVHKAKDAFKNQKVEHTFIGFDAYKQMMQTDIDYVMLATPPYFRPEMIKAAVAAGKHVFTEKPVAVDPAGARMVMEAGEEAKKKGLSIVAGTQRRHQGSYVEAYKRVLDGMIGKIVAARGYWNGGQLWYKQREEGQSDLEWMIRDWVNWSWLSGDHIVEQHVHNIDVLNWFLSKDGRSANPKRAVGMGGRARRVTGNQYDFFAVDFEYEDDVHAMSTCRQVNGCDSNVTEAFVGEKGMLFTRGDANGYAKFVIPGKEDLLLSGDRKGKKPIEGYHANPYVQEHMDLIDSIKQKKGLNEAYNVAVSTMTAIMGRIAAYTGKPVTWDEMMKSDLKLGPPGVSFETKLPPVEIPVPGRA